MSRYNSLPPPPSGGNFSSGDDREKDPHTSALGQRFNAASDLQVLRHCLGLQSLYGIPTIANQLADFVIVVCIDCEHWSPNSDDTTEIGIATFSRQDMFPLVQANNLGDHGENMLRRVLFNLLRIIENSHLPNTNPNSIGVLGNRFGRQRFVTLEEARNVLHNLFAQPITNVNGLQGYNHPIVVLGQATAHDRNNLKNKKVAFNMESTGTVIRYIDTQILARQSNYWASPWGEEIGLNRLCWNLEFKHDEANPHTALNDAARTLIAAFQMALKGANCKKYFNKTMQAVADDLEEYSRTNFRSLGGSEYYCWQCGSRYHMVANCNVLNLCCEQCGGHHITLHCMVISNQKAAARRKHFEDNPNPKKGNKKRFIKGSRGPIRNDNNNTQPWPMPPPGGPGPVVPPQGPGTSYLPQLNRTVGFSGLPVPHYYPLGPNRDGGDAGRALYGSGGRSYGTPPSGQGQDDGNIRGGGGYDNPSAGGGRGGMSRDGGFGGDGAEDEDLRGP